VLAEAAGVAGVLAVTAARVAENKPDDVNWAAFRRGHLRLVALAAGVLAWVTFVEGEPLASLNHPPVTLLPIAALLAFVLLGTVGIAEALLIKKLGWKATIRGASELYALPTSRKVALAVNSGVTQVVIVGYLFTRVTALTGSEVVALVASGVVFAVLEQGDLNRLQLWRYAVLGLSLSAAIALTGSLLGVMVAQAVLVGTQLLSTDPGDLPDTESAPDANA
jgi:hypothetical protein